LKRLLAGFVGDKVETKTATIHALSDLVAYQRKEMGKADNEEKKMTNHFKSSE